MTREVQTMEVKICIVWKELGSSGGLMRRVTWVVGNEQLEMKENQECVGQKSIS